MNRYERMNQERKIVDVRKRVAAYCRVSTDHEDQANSFESQQRYFRQYIERNPDWKLYEIFADEGISGTNTKKRSEFKRMIACAKEGDFDLIITKEISRFARNTLDSIYYTRDLKKHGVGVIFMNDNINTLDGDAELRLAIMSSIAQEESRKTSERVKWGQKRQMEQGVVFGRSMLGYDVKDGKMTINEDGAKIVRLIFHKFANENKGTHVIVSRELFEKANRILDEKSLTQEGKAKHSNRYPFSGKIKCGCCGSSYVARYKNRNNGTRYKAWRCYKSATQGSPHTDKAGNPLGCSNPSIRNEDAVHIMYLVTRSLQLEEKKITANLLSVIQSVLSVNINYSHIEKLKEQIQSVEDKRTQLIDLCISGAITKQEFITKREVCDKEISELQDTISGIDQQHLLADQQESVMKEITAAIHEIVSGVEYEDAFYSQILDKMVVQSKDTVDVYLNLLPIKWSYAVAKASKGVLDPKSGISETEIPISVNIARSSG